MRGARAGPASSAVRTQAPIAAGRHMETSTVVELEDLGDRTRMTMTHIGVPADSPGGQGWSMAIDKWETRVAALRA